MNWHLKDRGDIDLYCHEGVAFVLPASEGKPVRVKRLGSFGIGCSVRWSSWSIGIEFLRAGVLLQLGPCYFWAAHIEKQLSAFEKAKAMEAGTAKTERLGAQHDSAAPSEVCHD